MQALLSDSEEGGHTECLNLFEGHVRRFAGDLTDANRQSPENSAYGLESGNDSRPHPLWNNIPQNSRFYFVHSYYASPDNPDDASPVSDYPASVYLRAGKRQYICRAIPSRKKPDGRTCSC